VRQFGLSYAHPFIVLIVHQNEAENQRCGIVAGKSCGNAIQRNRAKRRIRAIVNELMPLIQPGWDVLFIARRPINSVKYDELQNSIMMLLRKANVISEQYAI
jgi:ribonuclease P protein component